MKLIKDQLKNQDDEIKIMKEQLSTFERNVDTKMDQMYDLLLVMYEKQ
jgi:flagellar capping protein FliD